MGLLIWGSTACSIDELDFPEKYGKAYCRKAKSCDSDAFKETWDSLDACVDDVEDIVDALVEVSTTFGGEYDPTNAGRCITQVKSASCESFEAWDFSTSCDDVID
tara:strand:+ start:160 stop:474 length:315 start_codon:yes stop_codon:yes gene_type:complete